MTVVGAPATDAARNAFSRGLLASGVSVNGLMASNNPQAAAKLFANATDLDRSMCDAWLARIVGGEDSIAVLQGAWRARETLGWETRRLSVPAGQFCAGVSDGLFVAVEITSQPSLGAALAVALCREARYGEADRVLREIHPTDVFDIDLHTYATGVLHFRTQRWADVLRVFPAEKRWRKPVYGAAAAAMAATALASLGVFEDAYRRGKDAVDLDLVPAATTIALYTQAMCLRHLGKAEDANQLLRRVYSRDPQFTPAREALDDPGRRLVVTNPETIEARTDPWDPASAPTAKQAEAARNAVAANQYLAEGEAELAAMLGMVAAKAQVKMIRATTKVNAAREKMGLAVPVTSRHTLLVGPPGCGKTTVARALTKQLCGLGVLRRHTVEETNKSRLIGEHLGETENATRELLEGALGGAVFIDEMHNLHDPGYSKGDPYGTAIIETLLPFMENHRDDLVVFGAGYPKAMERMLSANQGLRRRFSTTIVFESYTPDELWELTALMGAHDDDIVDPAAEAVLRPAFEHYYNTETLSPEGDVVRGIDWLGNAGFVRNLIEKARDHRNARLDDADLDALLAADEFDPNDDALSRRLRELTATDFAEGLAGAVADAKQRSTPGPDSIA